MRYAGIPTILGLTCFRFHRLALLRFVLLALDGNCTPTITMTTSLFIRRLPKAELHLHIEGTLEPEQMLAMARRNRVSLPVASTDEARDAYRFSNLQDFLDIYYRTMSVLLTERDFYDLTCAYLDRAAAQSVRHVEVSFDPQAHIARGVAMASVCRRIRRGLEYGRRRHGITSRIIMCFLRHLDEANALETLEEALPFRDWIYAVGLDSTELGNPPRKFARSFEKARMAGFARVAHAGEEGPPQYIREALELLRVQRIDHGNSVLEDPDLTVELTQRNIPLTICPLSNLKLGVVSDLAHHPLRKMLDVGLRVTLNSDDPAFFGGYINENYQAVQDSLKIDDETLGRIARNSFEASFIDHSRLEELLAGLDAYMREHTGWESPRRHR